MSARMKRRLFIWIHLVMGLAVMCYVYSPFHRFVGFQWTVKLVVVPFLVLSGIGLGKNNFRRKKTRSPGPSRPAEDLT